MQEEMTYASVGVDYAAMDPFKKEAQKAARRTSGNLARHGLEEVEWSRGESVYLTFDREHDCYEGHVHEGLGTKNLVADAVAKTMGWGYYYKIAQCTLAMGLNDAATLGVRPTTVTMHLGIGSSDWLENHERSQALIAGWEAACMNGRATWAGGETPTLRDIIIPGTAELSCSVCGKIESSKLLIRGNIESGDRIVLLPSSGIHANGLTLARRIASQVSDGYATTLSDGRPYGLSLLDATILYGPIVEDCQDAGAEIHYGVNITGHGWRKLMRLTTSATYVIETVPTPQPIFDFIRQEGPVSLREMYSDLNMGAGFALYVPVSSVDTVLEVALLHGLTAIDAGYIELTDDKKVIISPLGLEFDAETLAVR